MALGGCANCGAEIGGRYCAGCGQDARARLTFRELAGQALSGLLDLDSRFWSTLRDLVVPGKLTAEYLAGRRARYMPPVQTYLVVAVLFFAVVPAGLEAMVINAFMRADIERDAAVAGVAPAEHALRWSAEDGSSVTGTNTVEFQRGLSRFSLLMFLTMPLLALLLKGFHLSARRDYLDHLVFAIHLQTVAFAAATLTLLIEVAMLRLWWPAPGRWLWAPLTLGLFSYGMFAVRRVYGEHFAGAAFKFVVICFAYLVVLISAGRIAAMLGA